MEQCRFKDERAKELNAWPPQCEETSRFGTKMLLCLEGTRRRSSSSKKQKCLKATRHLCLTASSTTVRHAFPPPSSCLTANQLGCVRR